MDSKKVAEELLKIRERIDRCLDSETGNRQTALEDVGNRIARLWSSVTTGTL